MDNSMRLKWLIPALILGITAGYLPAEEASVSYTGYRPHQLIVKLKDPSRLKEGQDALAAEMPDRITGMRIVPGLEYLAIELNTSISLEEARRRMRNHPLVQDVSYNYLARIHDTVPDDPLVHLQYALENSGQEFYAEPEDEETYRGTSGADIDAFTAWDWNTGSGEITIAILDTGICPDHEDLEGKLVQGYNFINDSFETSDDNGHGTFVASIAAANTNNGIGMSGVNWAARLMPVKVADSEGYADYKSLALAIRYAAENGADILNISLGGPNPSFILEDALENALDNQVIIVASAGNTAASVDYPAAYDNYCLAVGASDENDEVTDYSNYGYSLDLVAPGDKVLGAVFDPAFPEVLNRYALGSGTSYAAPMVSAAAAILKSAKPFLDPEGVSLLIKYTADDINLETFPGVDIYAGYGRLNLNRLISPYTIE